MAAVLEVVGPPKARPVKGGPDGSRWPRSWSEQQLLLERQHDRLEAALTHQIETHCDGRSELDASEEQAEWAACSTLLRLLGLHLRLEERWLSQWSALCGGHRASHRQVATKALGSFRSGGHLRLQRLQWLMDINDWFSQHRHGADAIAYARASHNANPTIPQP